MLSKKRRQEIEGMIRRGREVAYYSEDANDGHYCDVIEELLRVIDQSLPVASPFDFHKSFSLHADLDAGTDKLNEAVKLDEAVFRLLEAAGRCEYLGDFLALRRGEEPSQRLRQALRDDAACKKAYDVIMEARRNAMVKTGLIEDKR